MFSVVFLFVFYRLKLLERKHGALRPQKPLRLIRDGEVGGLEILYLTPTRYTVTTGMTAFKAGSCVSKLVGLHELGYSKSLSETPRIARTRLM